MVRRHGEGCKQAELCPTTSGEKLAAIPVTLAQKHLVPEVAHDIIAL